MQHQHHHEYATAVAPPPLRDALVSVEAAWLCVAERDIEREDDERRVREAERRRRQVTGKYELDTAAQLDADLKAQQLARARRRRQPHKQLTPPLESLPALPGAARLQPPSSPQSQQRQATKRSIAIYESENQRLAAARRQPRRRPRQSEPLLPLLPHAHTGRPPPPRIAEDMLALERRYAASASRVQRWWRGLVRRRFWGAFLRQVRAATTIQRLVRGALHRALIRHWHRNRTHRATRIQAAFRGHYTRRVLVSWRQWEAVNATRIQALVRRHAAIKRLRRRREGLAAARIQCLWRGHRGRREADLRWLAVRVVVLQRLVRGALARRRVRRHRARYHRAAIVLQRRFRGVLARARILELLRERETSFRRDCMRALEAEEAWHRQQRDRLVTRLERFRLVEQVCDLEEQYFRAHERVNDMEAIYLDMQTQRLRVSPRAIEQGWVEEMEHKMQQQRAAITRLKLDVIFDLGLRFKRKEEELLELQSRIAAIEDKRRRFEIWRDEEFLDFWERECLYQHQRRQRERQRAIAEQRRRWGIRFHHLNGKPDKRWRGTHWCPEVEAEARRREGFCLGNTNTLAMIEARWRRHLEGQSAATAAARAAVAMDAPSTARRGEEDETQQRLSELEEQVQLVATNATIQQTMAIFDPVFRDVEARYEATIKQQTRSERKMRRRQREQEKKRQREQHDEEERRFQSASTGMSPSRRPGSPLPKVYAADRQERLARHRQAARVPWHLLDQLAGERRKLEEEKTLYRVWGRVHPKLFVTPSASLTAMTTTTTTTAHGSNER